jgi:O-methyltransferase involved in polyketide biosynthesis
MSTLYGKALDARVSAPILGDTLADEAVRQLDFDFASLKVPKGASVSLPVRAKHLDGWTREFLAAQPDCTVLHLGCGLDTRVFRIDPPTTVRWYDVDLPEMIELREQLYPRRPGYELISSSVTDPAWLERIPADRPVIAVAEGLVMHIPTADMVALSRRLTAKFPSGQFIFDVYSGLTARVITWASRFTFGNTEVSLHSGLPQALAKEVPALRLADAVPYLTLPELVSHLGTTAFARAYFRAVAAGFMRDSMLHMRYLFE